MQSARNIVASLIEAALRSRLDDVLRHELLRLAGLRLLGLGQRTRLLLHLDGARCSCRAGVLATGGYLLRHVRVVNLVLHVLCHGLLSLVHLLDVGARIVMILQLLSVVILRLLDLTAGRSAVGHVGGALIVQAAMMHVEQAG